MNSVQISPFSDAATDSYGAPHCQLTGASSTTYWQPDGFDLWVVRGSVQPGACLNWAAQSHGDEVVFVLAGAIAIDGGVTIGADGAFVVESGALCSATATQLTDVVHFGTVSTVPPGDGPFGAPSPTDHGVHVFDAEGSGRPGAQPELTELDTVYYGDGSCGTCRLALLRVWGAGAYNGVSHSHSSDELIHVTSGQIRVGPNAVGAGQTIAIPKDHRYSFRTPERWAFLNYRSDVSFITRNPRGSSTIETVGTSMRVE